MLSTFGFITPTTAAIVLVVALVIFGPGKLPDVGKALGRGIKEFKAESSGENREKNEIQSTQQDPSKPVEN